MAGRQAGTIGALSALAKGHRILQAVAYTEDLRNVLGALGVPVCGSDIGSAVFRRSLQQADVLLSVHGRQIVPEELLRLPKFGGVNVHPYLYKYKGADPVGRAFRDGEFKASVGAHRMGGRVDEGEVLVEDFVDVSGAESALDIYNRLYPYYAIVVSKALDAILQKKFHG